MQYALREREDEKEENLKPKGNKEILKNDSKENDTEDRQVRFK